MKLSIAKDVFLNALSHGQSVVERRTTVPILSHVLLSGSSQGLSLTTTDIDMALIETVPADIEEIGSICTPVHLLHEIVRKLDAKTPIAMHYQDNRLSIQSGRSHFTLSCLSPEDFPQLTHGPLTHRFSLPAKTLKSLVDTTRFAMSTDDARYYLNGIYLHALEGIFRLVATDMHRLSCVDHALPEGALGMPPVIVGRKTIQEILKLLDGIDGDISLGLSENRIECSFQTPTTSAVLTSRLIDGTFPDYQEAITQQHDKRLILNTKEFSSAMDRVATVVNERVRAVRMRLESGKAILSAVSQEFGSAIEEMDVVYDYQDSVEICFNVKYLMDVASQMTTDEMELLLTDADSSVLIHPHGQDKDCTFVVMPLRA